MIPTKEQLERDGENYKRLMAQGPVSLDKDTLALAGVRPIRFRQLKKFGYKMQIAALMGCLFLIACLGYLRLISNSTFHTLLWGINYRCRDLHRRIP